MVVPRRFLVTAEEGATQTQPQRQVENDFQIGAGFVARRYDRSLCLRPRERFLAAAKPRPDCATFPSRRSGQDDIGDMFEQLLAAAKGRKLPDVDYIVESCASDILSDIEYLHS